MKEIQYRIKSVRFRVPMERVGSRRMIERMMEKENLTLWQLANTHKIFGRNLKPQIKKMLYEAGYSPGQIDEVMKTDRKGGKKDG